MRKLKLTVRLPGEDKPKTQVVDVPDGETDTAAMNRWCSANKGGVIVQVGLPDGAIYSAPKGQESVAPENLTTTDPNKEKVDPPKPPAE